MLLHHVYGPPILNVAQLSYQLQTLMDRLWLAAVSPALDVKDDTEDQGPVQPRHLREAVRRLRRKPGTFIPSMKQRRPVFRL